MTAFGGVGVSAFKRIGTLMNVGNIEVFHVFVGSSSFSRTLADRLIVNDQ